MTVLRIQQRPVGLPKRASTGSSAAHTGARPAFDAFERVSGGPATVKRGTIGSIVRSLQQRLVTLGYMRPGEVSTGPGVYGPRTEHAVKRFQAAVGLPPTGAADARTQRAMVMADRLRPVSVDDATEPIPVSMLDSRLSATVVEDDEDQTCLMALGT